MKRIYLLDGVLILTLTLLSPIFLLVYGYLDVETYDAIKHINSFYRESVEPTRAYSNYRYFLVAIYSCLAVLYIGFVCEPSMRRISRFQIQCYRPYYLYHCAVCLIPFALRYANMTANISDDIMDQLDWRQLFSVLTSILQFIFSFFLSIVLRYRFWRLVLYVLITVIHAFVLMYLVYALYVCCLELLSNLKRSQGEFVTTWSYKDHEQIDEPSVSKINHYQKTFYLNLSLFNKTGQKQYQAGKKLELHSVDSKKRVFPYHREVLSVVNGESVKLPCSAKWKTPDSVNVRWSFNGSHVDSKMDITDTKIILERDNQVRSISSKLNINFLENFGFGDYTCFMQKYSYLGARVYFDNTKLNAMTYIMSNEFLIGQYSVRKYAKRDFYVYATPGGAIDLRWKSMNFNNDKEDIFQYYFVNGKHFERQMPSTVTTTCSSFSYLYLVYAETMNWFTLPYSAKSPDYLISNRYSYETHFAECAGSSVFGVHTVEYFRRIYDERSKTFVLREVMHPDTLYVLPDLPYFYKMDNASKAERNMIIRRLKHVKLDHAWFENSYHCVLIARFVLEPIVFIFFLIYFFWGLLKLWKFYTRVVIRPMRRMILGESLYVDQCSVRKSSKYSSYCFCADADKESVYKNLICPLRGQNISTGFNFEECDLNKCGKSIFDIQCDLIMQSDHLIFFITSSYLEEISTNDMHLETVLGCIQRNIFSASRVLFIIADNCELPDKLLYLFPEASSNIHDWVINTDFEARYRRTLEWIKKKKENKTPELVVSTIFVGRNISNSHI